MEAYEHIHPYLSSCLYKIRHRSAAHALMLYYYRMMLLLLTSITIDVSMDGFINITYISAQMVRWRH